MRSMVQYYTVRIRKSRKSEVNGLALLFMLGKDGSDLAGNKKGNTVEIVSDIVRPIVEGMGLTLWDVRFEKEGASWYLRVFIDKEGGVTIDDCENVSRAADPLIDEADPISQAYYFEVSSPGIGRDLIRPWHFDRYLGQEIELRLIRGENGQRDFMGALVRHDPESVTIQVGEEERSFAKKDCAFIRLHEEIDLSRDLD